MALRSWIHGPLEDERPADWTSCRNPVSSYSSALAFWQCGRCDCADQRTIRSCDEQIEARIRALEASCESPSTLLSAPRRAAHRGANEPAFEIRSPLFTLCGGVDLSELPGIGPYGALKLISEIADSGSLPGQDSSRIRCGMSAAASLAIAILRSVLALFRSREQQAIVELALRQQLATYAHRHPRPRLSPLDRAFWVVLSRFWPRWRSALIVVQPETVIRWHREGFRRYWRSISVPGPGRPAISAETKQLIVQMAMENLWRARKVQAELSKLGIEVSLCGDDAAGAPLPGKLACL